MNKVTSGLESRTNKTLIGTALLLTTVLNFSEALHIPQDIVGFIGTAITVIGTITGIQFRNLTAKNANAIIEETRNDKKNT